MGWLQRDGFFELDFIMCDGGSFSASSTGERSHNEKHLCGCCELLVLDGGDL